MPGGQANQVAWVSLKHLQPYREFEHTRDHGTTSLLTGERFPRGRGYTPEEWDAQVRSVREGGIREPVGLQYSPEHRRMYVGDGNHRMAWAAEAGHDSVPVLGLKGSRHADWEHARQVPGEPELHPDDEHGGYFPATFHPGKVLPPEWLRDTSSGKAATGSCPRCGQAGPHPLYDPGTGPAAGRQLLHGGPNLVEPGGFIHQGAMPQEHGRLQHNFFTTDRDVAEDAADMRDGLGHGWVHTVEPAGPYEIDHGERDSWRSQHPLWVVSVEPGRYNGKMPHPPIVRETAHRSATRAGFPEPNPLTGLGPHGLSSRRLPVQHPSRPSQVNRRGDSYPRQYR